MSRSKPNAKAFERATIFAKESLFASRGRIGDLHEFEQQQLRELLGHVQVRHRILPQVNRFSHAKAKAMLKTSQTNCTHLVTQYMDCLQMNDMKLARCRDIEASMNECHDQFVRQLRQSKEAQEERLEKVHNISLHSRPSMYSWKKMRKHRPKAHEQQRPGKRSQNKWT
ncbi:MAG: hypothetical protein MHM6MM_002642 [Cercozoa sp. M6MM]